MPRSLNHSFHSHKIHAKKRGIDFILSFEEWLKIWTDSGYLHERGKGPNKYCMARFGDKGPYAVGNVKIITNSENSKEAYPSMLGKTHTKKTKEKFREIGRKRLYSEETRKKMSESAKVRYYREKTLLIERKNLFKAKGKD